MEIKGITMSSLEQFFSKLVIDHAHQVIEEDYDLSLNRAHSFGPTHPRLVKNFLTKASDTNGLAITTELKFVKELKKTLHSLHQKDFFIAVFHSLSEVSAHLPKSNEWPILSMVNIWEEKIIDPSSSKSHILDWPGYLTIVISENELLETTPTFAMTLLDETLSFFLSFDLWRAEGKIQKLKTNITEALKTLPVETLEVTGLVFRMKVQNSSALLSSLKNHGIGVSTQSDEIIMSIPLSLPTTVFEQFKKAIDLN